MEKPNPFAKCECGHWRRSHLRSYDGGLGLGGCSTMFKTSLVLTPWHNPAWRGKARCVPVCTPCPCEEFVFEAQYGEPEFIDEEGATT